MAKLLDPSDYKVGWICALPLEFTAAVAVLDAIHSDLPRDEYDTNAYKFGRVGYCNIIVAGLPSGVYGLTSATTVATNLRRSFPSVASCLVVGIGGGAPLLPKNDIRLGDVVVSHPTPGYGGVLQYDYGKTVQTGKFEQTGVLNKPPDIFLAAITKFKSEYPPLGNKSLEKVISQVLDSGRVPIAFSRPSLESDDRLFKESYDHPSGYETCDHCDHKMVVDRTRRPSDQPEIHYGLIASANQVMKHGATRHRLSKEKDILCFEMEAAGVMDKIPSLIIRGICDYSDSHKNKRWQYYAALVAAVYARELILQLGPPPAARKLENEDPGRLGGIGTRDIFECLQALGGTNPMDDKIRIEQSKDKLIRESYYWILNDQNFQQWLWSTSRPILRISGDPGKGKTMIMIGMVDHMTEIFDHEINTRVAMSFFFCQATDGRLNNAVSVLKGLISQLISNPRYPGLVRYVKSEIALRGNDYFTGPNTLSALRRVFSKIFADPQYDFFCFMVDALDECSEGLNELLEVICSTSTNSQKVRWLTTSRNRPEIESHFESTGSQLQVSLELNNKHIGMTVDTYINSKVMELGKKKRYPAKVQNEVDTLLREKAGDTFLWVHLACKELEKAYSYNAVAILKNLPPGLNSFYKGLLEQISGSCYDENVKFCSQILSAAVVAFRPLSLREMVTVAGLPLAMDENDIEVQVKNCGSFLAIQHDTIFFVHQSAKDFLDEQVGSNLVIPRGLGHQHHEVVNRCLQQLQRELKMDICNLSDPNFPTNELTAKQRDPVIHLRYACYYWVNHLALVGPPTSTEAELVLSFLKKHLLHWMELMIVLDPDFETVNLFKYLEDIMRGAPNESLKELLYDLKRFSQYHQASISEAPLQLYSACLVFSPENSIIKSLFRHMMPEWIQRTTSLRKDWGSLVQAFEPDAGARVGRITLSSDDRILAIEIANRGFKLWDISSGAILHSLAPPNIDSVRSLRFSPDNKFIAAVTKYQVSTSITIWDVASGTGKIIYSRNTPGSIDQFETSMIWIPSSTPTLVYANTPKDLVLVHTELDKAPEPFIQPQDIQCRRTKNAGEAQLSLACSNLGTHLASGAESFGFILLWDVVSRAPLMRIDISRVGVGLQTSQGRTPGAEMHMHNLENVEKSRKKATKSGPQGEKQTRDQLELCFTTDHQLLVARGKALYKVGGIGTNSPSFAEIVSFDSYDGPTPSYRPQFLQNGSRLAIRISADILRIYDTHSGGLLRSLNISFGQYTVLNSSMSQYFIGKQSAVRILDVPSENLQQLRSSENIIQEYYNLAVSPNWKFLATCQGSSIIVWEYGSSTPPRLWDAHGGEHAFKRIDWLEFSPDGEQLASSTKQALSFWRTRSGSHVRTLQDWPRRLWEEAEIERSSRDCLWNYEYMKKAKTPAGDIVSTVFSFTGKLAVLGSCGRVQVRMFDPNSDSVSTRRLSGFNSVDSTFRELDIMKVIIRFSPDGSLVMTQTEFTIELRNAASGELYRTFNGWNKSVIAAAFSPTGKQLSMAFRDSRSRTDTLNTLTWSSGQDSESSESNTLPNPEEWAHWAQNQVIMTDGSMMILKSSGGWLSVPSMTYFLRFDHWLCFRGRRILAFPPDEKIEVTGIYQNTVFLVTSSGAMMTLEISQLDKDLGVLHNSARR
ncbi:uncharacterized protein DFL_004448 [Arthrobotrys flagrans]|uniref:Nephrocystin 3-like N-terminal domain-containing protein n=1 Tax=Arthrobotrys flagrans TaxID=97331 RepID=A0A437A4U9_ARTFL|nr:hypothetical protein DFL_004448 [Arthrobotrys flagrans]